MEATDFLYRFRFIIIGDSGVGKSCLLRKMKDQEFHPGYTMTVGVDFHVVMIEVNGFPIKIHLWDTTGQEKFGAIVKAYYRNAVGALLVFDMTNRGSFERGIEKWRAEAIQYSGDNKPVFMLIGSKSDLENDRQVSTAEALSYACDHNMEYMETSAKTGFNVDECFHALTKRIFQLIQDGVITMQDGWDGVKEGDISTLKRNSHPYAPNGNVSLNNAKPVKQASNDGEKCGC